MADAAGASDGEGSVASSQGLDRLSFGSDSPPLLVVPRPEALDDSPVSDEGGPARAARAGLSPGAAALLRDLARAAFAAPPPPRGDEDDEDLVRILDCPQLAEGDYGDVGLPCPAASRSAEELAAVRHSAGPSARPWSSQASSPGARAASPSDAWAWDEVAVLGGLGVDLDPLGPRAPELEAAAAVGQGSGAPPDGQVPAFDSSSAAAGATPPSAARRPGHGGPPPAAEAPARPPGGRCKGGADGVEAGGAVEVATWDAEEAPSRAEGDAAPRPAPRDSQVGAAPVGPPQPAESPVVPRGRAPGVEVEVALDALHDLAALRRAAGPGGCSGLALRVEVGAGAARAETAELLGAGGPTEGGRLSVRLDAVARFALVAGGAAGWGGALAAALRGEAALRIEAWATDSSEGEALLATAMLPAVEVEAMLEGSRLPQDAAEVTWRTWLHFQAQQQSRRQRARVLTCGAPLGDTSIGAARLAVTVTCRQSGSPQVAPQLCGRSFRVPPPPPPLAVDAAPPGGDLAAPRHLGLALDAGSVRLQEVERLVAEWFEDAPLGPLGRKEDARFSLTVALRETPGVRVEGAGGASPALASAPLSSLFYGGEEALRWTTTPCRASVDASCGEGSVVVELWLLAAAGGVWAQLRLDQHRLFARTLLALAAKDGFGLARLSVPFHAGARRRLAELGLSVRELSAAPPAVPLVAPLAAAPAAAALAAAGSSRPAAPPGAPCAVRAAPSSTRPAYAVPRPVCTVELCEVHLAPATAAAGRGVLSGAGTCFYIELLGWRGGAKATHRAMPTKCTPMGGGWLCLTFGDERVEFSGGEGTQLEPVEVVVATLGVGNAREVIGSASMELPPRYPGRGGVPRRFGVRRRLCLEPGKGPRAAGGRALLAVVAATSGAEVQELALPAAPAEIAFPLCRAAPPPTPGALASDAGVFLRAAVGEATYDELVSYDCVHGLGAADLSGVVPAKVFEEVLCKTGYAQDLAFFKSATPFFSDDAATVAYVPLLQWLAVRCVSISLRRADGAFKKLMGSDGGAAPMAVARAALRGALRPSGAGVREDALLAFAEHWPPWAKPGGSGTSGEASAALFDCAAMLDDTRLACPEGSDGVVAKEECSDPDQPSLEVHVSHALHLPLVEGKCPSAFVSYTWRAAPGESDEEDELGSTEVIFRTTCPAWGHTARLPAFADEPRESDCRRWRLGRARSALRDAALRLRVWHMDPVAAPGERIPIGVAAVPLAPLTAGFAEVDGYFHIEPAPGACASSRASALDAAGAGDLGQLRVRVRPRPGGEAAAAAAAAAEVAAGGGDACAAPSGDAAPPWDAAPARGTVEEAPLWDVAPARGRVEEALRRFGEAFAVPGLAPPRGGGADAQPRQGGADEAPQPLEGDGCETARRSVVARTPLEVAQPAPVDVAQPAPVEVALPGLEERSAGAMLQPAGLSETELRAAARLSSNELAFGAMAQGDAAQLRERHLRNMSELDGIQQRLLASFEAPPPRLAPAAPASAPGGAGVLRISVPDAVLGAGLLGEELRRSGAPPAGPAPARSCAGPLPPKLRGAMDALPAEAPPSPAAAPPPAVVLTAGGKAEDAAAAQPEHEPCGPDSQPDRRGELATQGALPPPLVEEAGLELEAGGDVCGSPSRFSTTAATEVWPALLPPSPPTAPRVAFQLDAAGPLPTATPESPSEASAGPKRAPQEERAAAKYPLARAFLETSDLLATPRTDAGSEGTSAAPASRLDDSLEHGRSRGATACPVVRSSRWADRLEVETRRLERIMRGGGLGASEDSWSTDSD